MTITIQTRKRDSDRSRWRDITTNAVVPGTRQVMAYPRRHDAPHAARLSISFGDLDNGYFLRMTADTVAALYHVLHTSEALRDVREMAERLTPTP